MSTLSDHITMTVKAGTKPSPWGSDSNHFRVTLACQGRTMSLDFWQGTGLKDEPRLKDVLDCLLSDASGVNYGQTFEEWCGDYGYDTDSRQAEQTYRAAKRQTARLGTLLGGQKYVDHALEAMNDEA